MISIYRQGTGFNKGAPVNPEHCAASVSTHERWPRWYQCTRKWTVEEGYSEYRSDPSVLYKWCGVHAPSAEKARAELSAKRYQESVDNSPWVRLGTTAAKLVNAQKRIETLRAALRGAGVSAAQLEMIDPTTEVQHEDS